MHPALYILLFFSLTLFIPAADSPSVKTGPETSVEEVLVQLGEAPAPHQVDTSMVGVSAQKGYELVTQGRTIRPDGGRTARQSRHFYCTSCHNLVVEDPDLSVSEPQARLEFARDNGLPFLQGTTLYGVVNRRSYYNGDYEKKYGPEEVAKARYDLREAIQLCAVGCAQGRALEDWEIESVLAFLWTLELKLGDLGLEEGVYEEIDASLKEQKARSSQQAAGSEEQKARSSQHAAGSGEQPARSTQHAAGREGVREGLAEMIHSKYLLASPATFTPPPADRDAGYGLVGDPANGELIYELSCLHCHENGRYSFYHLDHSPLSLNHLSYHMSRYTPYSLYQVGRYGTVPLHGKKSYMPQYTQEKMSDQQMEDLRAYIERGAGSEE